MGQHQSDAEAIRTVYKGLVLLAVATVVEVAIALLGKGHIVAGFYLPVWFMVIMMVGISLYKAYFIVSEFMHVRYEVTGLALSILLPLLLLIWAIIAFMAEGSYWKGNRVYIEEKDRMDLNQGDEMGQTREDVYRELL